MFMIIMLLTGVFQGAPFLDRKVIGNCPCFKALKMIPQKARRTRSYREVFLKTLKWSFTSVYKHTMPLSRKDRIKATIFF